MSPDLIANVAAEQIILGAMLTSADAVAETQIMAPQDFMRPAHQMIFENIRWLAARQEPGDPVAVAARMLATGELKRAGGAGYLHTLMASVPVAVNTAYYARIVMELAAKRRLAEAGTRLAQLAQEADGTAEEILSRAEAELARAGAHLRPPEDDGAMDIGAFAQEDLPFGAEVIPGLLREQERVITVAAEGSGKTYLAMQVAVMSAAGLHVFSQDAIEPVRTLMVDLENPSATAQRRSRMLLAQAERVPGWDAGRCWIWSKPGGLDLREPSDQRRLLNVIDRAGPSLIVAGPVYKMSVDRGERGEQLHGSVTTFWDGVRERLGAALWLEHHAPLGQGTRRDMRPVGTALWLRWCEFGLALTPNLDRRGSLNVGTFRGHREEGRMWPYRLDRGEPWPWSAVYPNGTF